MPYITRTARQIIDHGGPIATVGELNYAITKRLLNFDYTPQEIRLAIEAQIYAYLAHKGLSYCVINDIIGALECARREFKRRRGFDLKLLTDIADGFYGDEAAKYEDEKIKTNSDVYPT
jgi:hypothetical protein